MIVRGRRRLGLPVSLAFVSLLFVPAGSVEETATLPAGFQETVVLSVWGALTRFEEPEGLIRA
jgi:hypothetical protein